MTRGGIYMHIRNSAKAIIIQNDKVLLTKNLGNDEFFYILPGGGQEHGETLHQALIRECIKELSQHVEVGKLLHIREYIGKNHEYAAFHSAVHQVEYYFICNIINETESFKPSQPDPEQVGIVWLPIRELLEYEIYPKQLRQYIMQHFYNENAPVYLGDIN